MAKKVYEEENIRAIADKIREKTGSETTYKTSDMPGGVETVYEAGKEADRKERWNSVIHYPNEWYFTFAGAYWNNTTFDPPYDLTPPAMIQLFYQSKITDLKGILERNGVKLDFSKSKRFQSIYEQSAITRSPEIDTRSCANLSHFLYNANELISVDKVILKDDGSQTWTDLGFRFLKSLEDVTFEGTIGCNMDISTSPLLSHDSLMSIINALKDYSDKTVLSFSDATYDVRGLDTDPRGLTFDVHYAEIVDGSLECECSIDGMDGIKITVYDVDISEADLPYIKALKIDVVDFDADGMPITNVVITVDKTVLSKTLTLGETNLAKLTDAEKKKATDKGWALK